MKAWKIVSVRETEANTQRHECERERERGRERDYVCKTECEERKCVCVTDRQTDR